VVQLVLVIQAQAGIQRSISESMCLGAN